MTDPLAPLLASDPVLASVADEVARRSGDDPGHDIHHARRVATWTLRLAEGRVPARLCVAAALLHDVVNVPKDSPHRALASTRSAELARQILGELGLDPTEAELVAEAIADHSYSRGKVPRSELGRALQDADRLEALGALGLMRCVSTGARMSAAYFEPEDPWAEHRSLDDARYSIDHFFTKLLRLPASMQTEAGRREAERRAEFMRSFLRQLGDELGSAPPAQRIHS